MTGGRVARIAAVDPADPQKLYLRLTGADDAIAVSSDGGATIRVPLVVGVGLTALLRRANGQVLVSALDVVQGALYRSTDGGESFVRMPSTLSIRAMAERSGTIYAAADYFADGFALGVSRDDGLSFQPLMKLDQVAGTRIVRQPRVDLRAHLRHVGRAERVQDVDLPGRGRRGRRRCGRCAAACGAGLWLRHRRGLEPRCWEWPRCCLSSGARGGGHPDGGPARVVVTFLASRRRSRRAAPATRARRRRMQAATVSTLAPRSTSARRAAVCTSGRALRCVPTRPAGSGASTRAAPPRGRCTSNSTPARAPPAPMPKT